MNSAHLSDSELLRLVRRGGEPSFHALQELEQRHFTAVRDFAVISAANPAAADELAYQSWEAALRQQVDGGAGGAVRPWALSSVLRLASGWARGNQRVALNPHLAAWAETSDAAPPESTATARLRRPSLVARAFAGLPHRSQTVLWHRTVEHDDSVLTGQLSGVGAGEVSVLTGRAHGELHDSYVQVLRDGMRDECRHYHRLTLAYADTRSANIAAQVAPHLQRCARCSRAVADIARMRHDCGALLVRALLPWGGPEYAARGANGGVDREDFRENSLRAAGTSNAAAAGAPPARGRTREGLVPRPAGTGSRRIGGRAAGTGRHAALGAPGTVAHSKGRARADLIVRCTAVAGVCAVGAAFAFGFAGDSATEEPQAKDPGPPAKALVTPTRTPSPSRTTATAKSTSKPKPPSKPGNSEPAPPEPGPTRPSSPSVPDAAVEWLFDKVDAAGVTPDSSDNDNDNDGTLFGASRPQPVSGGGLAFDGQQFVASAGPLVDTSSSFSVSARVRLDRTDVSQTVVSQDAENSSAFLLQYDADESQWEMRLPEEDTDDAEGDADEAASESGAVAGEWTQLTGVYDDADDEVRLYVDGRLGETADRDDDFESQGSFVVGRGLSGNEFFHGVDGTVEDVRAFDRALSSAEAKSLARKSR